MQVNYITGNLRNDRTAYLNAIEKGTEYNYSKFLKSRNKSDRMAFLNNVKKLDRLLRSIK